MTTRIVVGAQWGDEGKGKVVDYMASQAKLVARYAGGNNAGHTLVLGERKLVTHLVPSGCAYPGTLCVLGAGMVIDVDVLQAEVADLQRVGMLQADELRVSLDAHVILPYHRALDGLREDQSAGRLGTTRRGIGPAYEAKAARRGVRIRDLLDPARLRPRLVQNKDAVDPELVRLGGAAIDVDAILEHAASWSAWLKGQVCDAGALVHAAITRGESVLIEGAQGALLDLDHGTYPFVTSSTTLAGGACAGLGIGPTLIDEVWGITKAYATRVGAGPFPTCAADAAGDLLRQAGAEYGATTGRPRDCGWLDLPALRHAARLNGLTGLCVTKLDVLAALPSVQLCTRYRGGAEPGVVDLADVVPEYEEVPGWGDPSLRTQIAAARRLEDLPSAARAYLDGVESAVGVPIVLVSVGPDREQTILTGAAFASR
jgi:adenylosuccinate synthase